MGWNTKRRGTAYFYVSYHTADGRVAKRYIGRGPGVRLLAERHGRGRLARAAARRAEQEFRARLRSEAQALDAVGTAARALLAAELVLAGHHDHRGQWRRRM